MAIIKWDYSAGLAIKVVDRYGSDARLWTPQTSDLGAWPKTRIISCGPPQYEQLTIQREDIDLNLQPKYVGHRASLSVVLMTLGGRFYPLYGSTGQYDLETVISTLSDVVYPSSSLWVALHYNPGLGTSDFKKVVLRSGWKPQKLNGKNVGQVVQLDFLACDWQRAVPTTEGSAW